MGCLKRGGKEGKEDKDYILTETRSRSNCEQDCLKINKQCIGWECKQCIGWEWTSSSNRCESWTNPIRELEDKPGTDCYINDPEDEIRPVFGSLNGCMDECKKKEPRKKKRKCIARCRKTYDSSKNRKIFN